MKVNIKQTEVRAFKISNVKRFVLVRSITFLNGGSLENNNIVFRIWVEMIEAGKKVKKYFFHYHILPIDKDKFKKTDLYQAIIETGLKEFELKRLQLINSNSEINIDIEILSE